MRKAYIVEKLWPGKEETRARNCLYKVCAEYRKAGFETMGLCLIIQKETIGVSLSNIECDLIQFVSLYKENSIESFEKAIALYTLPPFTNECYEWTLEYTGYYEIRYIKMLETVCEYYKSKNFNKYRIYNTILEKISD